MIMRINPYVGISRMKRFRMVDMCKGKKKLWLRGTNNVLVVGLHMVGKRVKVSSLNNVTSFLALYFFFYFTWFIPLISLLPLLFSLFLLFPFSYFFSFLTFLYFFFLFHTHTSLFIFPSLDNFSKLSTPLFLACIQSEILNKLC
jgi:hypothetical protein